MKTSARCLWMIAALAGSLVLSGCAISPTVASRTREVRQTLPASDFAIVESSSGRQLSAKEASQLREAVAKFLESQGVDRKGDYYVRVDFAPASPGEPGEWVVVKLTNLPGSTYTLIAAYPAIGPDDYYPGDYYSYDQRYGYTGFDFGYYEPAIFYPTNYHPWSYPLTPRGRGGDQPGDHRPGDRDRHPRGPDDGRHDRTDAKRDHDHRPDNTGYAPRSPDANGGSRDPVHRTYVPRPYDNGGPRDHGPRSSAPAATGQRSGGASYSPPPAPAPAPAPRPVAQPARDAENNSRNSRQLQN